MTKALGKLTGKATALIGREGWTNVVWTGQFVEQVFTYSMTPEIPELVDDTHLGAFKMANKYLEEHRKAEVGRFYAINWQTGERTLISYG